jgi:parallel beta-helix repeat protein
MNHRVLLVGLLGLLCLAVCPVWAVAETHRVPEAYRTIQAAVDAAGPGDTVLVAAGVYRERVRMKPGVVLRSAGGDRRGELGLIRAEATIIDGGGEAEGGAGVQMAEGATLDGFTVRRVGRYDAATWEKHHQTRGADQMHEHIGQPGTPGVEVRGVSCVVKNNITHHNGYTGIAVTGVEGKRTSPRIFGNVSYRNMGGGIGSMDGSTALIESNLCFENFYAGIGHHNASPVVTDNECYSNIRAGIGISEGSSPVVRGNRCYGNQRAGIGIRTGDKTRPVVEGNDCYENAMAGIGVSEGAAPIVRDNRCYGNGMAGIGSESGARPMIVGNECYENEWAGIGQDGVAETLLIGNHVHDNGEAGIGFDGGDKSVGIVVGNRVIDNAMVAVGVNSGWQVHLIDNELSRRGGAPPVAMVFEGARANFLGNTLRGDGVAGIRAAGGVRVIGNRLKGVKNSKGRAPGNGVWGLAGAEIVFGQNVVTGWQHGLNTKGAAVNAWGNRISDYEKFGVKISEPSAAPYVVDNVLRDSESRPAFEIQGEDAVVAGNRVVGRGESSGERRGGGDR